MEEPELTRLAVAFQGGDQRSFRLLVEATSRTLMAMAYRYTLDWEWARDLTQETWMRVAQGIQRYDARRPFIPWLFGVHRNICVDHLRRPWVVHEATRGEETMPEPPASPRDQPDHQVEQREFRERILMATRELSDAQREVFLRVDLEQGDPRAVARTLGMREGTLRVTLHHARKRMAAALRRMEESPA